MWAVVLLAALSGASDPLQHNGGAILALAGKQCVAIVTDTRLGAGNALVGESAVRVLRASPAALLAVHGLQGDVFSILDDVSAELRLRRLDQRASPRGVEPRDLAELLSSTLYGGRARGKPSSGYFVEPIIAGLERDGRAYICEEDSLGAMLVARDYVACGSAKASLYGACEAFYRRDLGPDDLLLVAERCAKAALDRDCLSGCQAQVHLLSDVRGHELFEFDLAP